jgi:GNAT superfamily N-acetyltransferase
MATDLTVRPAARGDVSAIARLLAQLGYPAPAESVSRVLTELVDDGRHSVLVGEDAGGRIVALLSLSSRPVLRLQGRVGTIEEFVVAPGLRGRGIGDRLLRYAKGVAAERGWVRLETAVPELSESHRRGFLLARGFVTARCATYRWAPLEQRDRAAPAEVVEARGQVA